MNSSLNNFFRLNFKFQTDREVHGVGGFFIKGYMNELECVYKYNILKKIADAYPLSLYLKCLSYFINHERELKGTSLKNYAVNYLSRENESLKGV